MGRFTSSSGGNCWGSDTARRVSALYSVAVVFIGLHVKKLMCSDDFSGVFFSQNSHALPRFGALYRALPLLFLHAAQAVAQAVEVEKLRFIVGAEPFDSVF